LLADRLAVLPPPPGITLGYRPSMPHVEIKVFARGAAALSALDDYLPKLRALLADAVVSERFATLAEEVHTLLRDLDVKLSLAESCTGGMLASLLVDYPGSSDYLQQGLITYSNAAKMRLLNVPAAVIDAHGAVSTETAIAMARGARELADSDYALAVTGIAGPDGGLPHKPVGTVVFALADRQTCWSQTIELSQRSRTLVRTMSCAVALDMLRRRLLGVGPLVDYPFMPARHSHVEQNH